MMEPLRILIDAKYFSGPEGGPQRRILAPIELQLNPGEFVVLVGPSGCGKSTLLHIVAGLDRAFRGKILWPTARRGSSRLGYVFQNPRLLPWLRVRDNIELILEKPSTKQSRVDALLHATGLDEFGHFYPDQLSLGMQRRVALARAFAVEPYLLLMDEPFVSLDQPTANQLRELLIRVWSTHRSTVLFVTHDLLEAVTLADRIVFLSASPARVIGDAEVDIPRSQRGRTELIEACYSRLKRRFDQFYGDE